jgi:membrane protease YdiL (CAAX protease family)
MQQAQTTDNASADVPWSAAEFCFALFLVFFFWQVLVFEILHSAGLFARLYGPDAVSLARADDNQREKQRLALGVTAGSALEEAGLPLLRRLALNRLNLWTVAFAFPFQVISIPGLLYAVSRTRPAQLGLTCHRLGPNLMLGGASFVVVTPAVLALNSLVEELYRSRLGGEPQIHALTLIASQKLAPVEWILLVLSGTVIAPVIEELVFRGMLQPWFAARPWGSQAALAAAFGWALYSCWDRVRAAVPSGLRPTLFEASPALFVVALAVVNELLRNVSRTPAVPAVFATAVLFAAVHSSVWPTPVALVVLGLALGIMAWRTKSLVAPIILHSLFNGVGCIRLLLSM